METKQKEYDTTHLDTSLNAMASRGPPNIEPDWEGTKPGNKENRSSLTVRTVKTQELGEIPTENMNLLQRIVSHQYYDLVAALLITANAIMIGVQADWSAA